MVEYRKLILFFFFFFPTTCSDKFSKVIKIEPYNRKYYNLHAATYLRLGEYEKARQDAGKAIDIKPGCSSWCLWGQASFWLGYSSEFYLTVPSPYSPQEKAGGNTEDDTDFCYQQRKLEMRMNVPASLSLAINHY